MPAQHFRRRIFSAVPLLFITQIVIPYSHHLMCSLITEGFRSHLLMNHHVQLTARRGYGHKFFIASQQPATL